MYTVTLHLGLRKLSYSWYLGLFAVEISENFWFHVFNIFHPFHTAQSWWFIVKSETSENVWVLVQAVPPTKIDVFCPVYSHPCSIYLFLSVVHLQSQCSRSRTDGNKYILLIFPANLLLLLSFWEFLRSLTAELILEWKHRYGCFPMWCRFSSLKVCLVALLQFRGHM